ncbi:MAG: hypothetical protein HY237_03250 [Acidobacteria bacterium]|nr:hypothetical protein [Acidobacteriota bacterium]
MTEYGTAPAKEIPQPKDRVVTIIVTETPREVMVVPDLVRVNKFDKDTVTWVCPQGFDFEVEFPETPFHGHRFDQRTAKNLIPREDVVNNAYRPYKYDVIVAGITKDPGLIVDP